MRGLTEGWPLREWRLRYGGTVRLLVRLTLAYAAVLVATSLLGWGPDALRLALIFLLVGVSGAVALRLLDPAHREGWGTMPVSARVDAGRDQRTQLYLRIVQSHLTTRTPDGTLRDRVAGLADRTLAQRHGVRLGDPLASELLGEELVGVLSGGPQRLDPARLDRLLARIERL